MNQDELNQKFQMFENQIMQLQQQLQVIEQAIMDMTQIDLGLEDLKGKKDEEIMAPIGRGIYVQAKMLSEEMIVDVGGKNFVKKSIPETKELIKSQLKNLEGLKKELEGELDKINSELTSVMKEYQQAASQGQ
jgi:prefoldin alpha subunit